MIVTYNGYHIGLWIVRKGRGREKEMEGRRQTRDNGKEVHGVMRLRVLAV